MLQTIDRTTLWLIAASAFFAAGGDATAADRTTMLLPLRSDAAGGPVDGVLPDDAFADAASPAWRSYIRVWRAHHQSPGDASIRRFLGLPDDDAMEVTARRGVSAPRWLKWRPRSFAQIDTPHFVIYSRAPREPSLALAKDLERCYWLWTQLFFPLWEARDQVASSLQDMTEESAVSTFLQSRDARITTRKRLRVVLFAGAEEYRSTLSPRHPGVEQSTGFYDTMRQTTYLYASDQDDAATRRHELVHQLFRESTRSNLGRTFPAEDEGFWLIEGIAGYCESLFLTDRFATVGGWDCSRLQFARYRMLVGGDMMPLKELRRDGRRQAQSRQDLARWYAHAIAHTHLLMDGPEPSDRRWVYHQLAERYKVTADLPPETSPEAPAETEGRLRRFLAVRDDQLTSNPNRRPLENLVLAECQVSRQALQTVPPAANLRWLDLARLRIDNADVMRLAPQPASIEQLTLEACEIDSGLADWLKQATGLLELDLSFTKVGDSVVRSVASAHGLSVLWLTGSEVTDASIDTIIQMKALESVDLQRTAVTDSGLRRLKAARPQLQINPLQLRTQ